jgi:anti-sigma regulatory factor (Ser/Thr protein kinase)
MLTVLILGGREAAGMGSVCELTSGSCLVWPLPADLSCAATARTLYRTAAAAVGLGAGLVYDGVTMASELAANTLHAAGPGGRSEFWLCLRGHGFSRELVCEVFDPSPAWSSGFTPSLFPRPVPPEATSGRGLQVVHELSGGRWGHHPTSSRLGRPACDGKVVWFALPAPA